jgi:hypothetical protein
MRYSTDSEQEKVVMEWTVLKNEIYAETAREHGDRRSVE